MNPYVFGYITYFSFSSIQYNYIMQIRLKCKHYINTFLYSICIFYIYITQRAKKLRFIHLSADRIAVWLYRSVYPSAKCKIQTELNDTRIYTRDERCKKKTYISVQSNLVMEAELQNFLKFTCVFFHSLLLLLLLCVFFFELLFAFQTEYRILRVCWSFVFFSLLYLGSYFFPLSHGNKARYFVVYLPV